MLNILQMNYFISFQQTIIFPSGAWAFSASSLDFPHPSSSSVWFPGPKVAMEMRPCAEQRTEHHLWMLCGHVFQKIRNIFQVPSSVVNTWHFPNLFLNTQSSKFNFVIWKPFISSISIIIYLSYEILLL